MSWWAGENNALDREELNNGTLAGSTSYGTGVAGQAFVLDGNGDAVQLGSPTSLHLQNFTIEAWIKRTSSSALSADSCGHGMIFGFGGGGYGLYLQSPEGSLRLTRINVDNVTAGVNITDTNWHHVAVTKNGSAVVFYVDGVAYPAPVYNTTYTFSSSAAIGARGDYLSCSFFGRIDELSIYSRALANNEIQSIYSAGGIGKCTTNVAPVITTHPTNQSVAVTGTAIFNVTASGTAPLSYQWRCNGTNIAGATTTQLTLANVQLTNAGVYSVLVSNSVDSVTSSNALLSVYEPPCAPPPSGLISWWRAAGDTSDESGVNHGTLMNGANFAAGKVGQGFNLNGSGQFVQVPHSASLNLTNEFTLEFWYKQTADANYALIAKRHPTSSSVPCNFGFNVNSGTMFLYFLDPALSGYRGVTCPAPSLGVFHHLAGTYRQVDANNVELKIYIDGQLAQTQVVAGNLARSVNNYVMTIGADNETGFFLTGIIDEVGIYARALSLSEIQTIHTASSLGKCVTVTPPLITSQPTNQTVTVGGIASFSVTASGTSPLSYQWRFNGTNIDGATGTSLVLTEVQLSQAGDYSVVVTNSADAATSSNAVLTVNPPPPCSTPPSGLVSWWRGQSNTLDQVGNNHGTFAGSAAYGAGYVGKSFVLDGNGDAVRMGNPASLHLQNFTIEAWIKRGSASAVSLSPCGHGMIFSYGGGGYGLYLQSPEASLRLTRLEMDNVTAGVNISDTNWHHVAVTKSGTSVVFYVDGIAYPAPPYSTTYNFSTQVAIGARGDNLACGFLGSIDDVAIFNRALSTFEIQAIYNAGVAGKCIISLPPSITTQPTNRTVTVGGTATFNVVSGGTLPLSYQWLFDGTNLAGATGSSLTLNSIQFNQAGNYSVVVTNEGGSAISSNALLTVNFPPALVRVANTNAASASTVVVPVLLAANGNENALGFSLNFSTSRLAYASVSLGGGLGAATLFVNDSQAGSGKLGLAFSLPAGNTLPAGTQAVALVTFTTAVVTNVSATTLSFGDSPIVRQLVDAPGNPLPANYASGTVTIAAVEFEGDVSPRPVGDRLLTIADWVLVGRYAARLDYPTNATEFQRADCAPRGSLGNGRIRVGDWVQAGRYAAGLDSGTPLGGPTFEDSEAMAKLSGPIRAAGPNGGGAARQVRVANVALAQNQTGVISVHLKSQGDENALGFSLTFDPAVFGYVGTSVGGAASGATLNVNTSQVGAGKLGVVLALSPGSHFAAGTQEIVKVSLRAAAGATNGNAVTFANDPVPQEVTDATALELTADYVNGTVTVNPPPTLTIARAGEDVRLSWPLWASNFTPQVMDALATPPAWTNVAGTVGVSGEENVLTLPITSNTKFYRLVSP